MWFPIPPARFGTPSDSDQMTISNGRGELYDYMNHLAVHVVSMCPSSTHVSRRVGELVGMSMIPKTGLVG
jgi:hypothetical protein